VVVGSRIPEQARLENARGSRSSGEVHSCRRCKVLQRTCGNALKLASVAVEREGEAPRLANMTGTRRGGKKNDIFMRYIYLYIQKRRQRKPRKLRRVCK